MTNRIFLSRLSVKPKYLALPALNQRESNQITDTSRSSIHLIKSWYYYRVNSSSTSNLTITQLNRLNPRKYRNLIPKFCMIHLNQIIHYKDNQWNSAWFIMNQSNRLTQKQSRKICMIHHESIKSSNIKTIMKTLHDPWWISQIVPTQKWLRKLCMTRDGSVKSSNIKTITKNLHDPWWINHIVQHKNSHEKSAWSAFRIVPVSKHTPEPWRGLTGEKSQQSCVRLHSSREQNMIITLLSHQE